MILNTKLSLGKPREKPDTEEIKIYIDYIGEDGYVYKYSPSLKKYIKSEICVIGPKGNPGPKGEDGKVDYNRLKRELNLDDYATIEYVDTEITTLIGGAPDTLDTLKEIADYIESHGNDFADLIERVDDLEDCCEEVNNTLTTINNNISDLQTNKADKTQLNNYVLKSGDTMSGTLNFSTNNAISIQNTQAVAWAGGRMSFGNIYNPTQIRSNDHINITTRDNVWTVWDSGNFNPDELRQIILDNELTVSAALNDLHNIIEEDELTTAAALNDLEDRKLDKADAGELNIIEDIKVNGVSIQPVDKSIDIAVPTKISDLTNDLAYNTVTYNQLVTLVNNNQLIPGQKYRITDYVTTTMQNDTYSEENQFDIIVTALSENTLSIKANACLHEGDTYFQNSNLSAWDLDYTVDNIYWSRHIGNYFESTSLGLWFKQVDSITVDNTRYIIWYNKDYNSGIQNMTPGYLATTDFDIDVPYYAINTSTNNVSSELGTIGDLKVITSDGKGTITRMKDEFNNECPYDFKNIKFTRWLSSTHPSADSIYYSISNLNSYAIGQTPSSEVNSVLVFTFSNIQGSNVSQQDGSLNGTCLNNKIEDNSKHVLNNNVVYGSNNIIKYNSFGNSIMGSNNIIFGNYNVLDSGASKNTVYGNNNYFVLNCIGNILRYDNSYNLLWSGNEHNTFEQECAYNVIEHDGRQNHFGEGCNHVSISAQYSENIIIENGNQYIDLDVAEPGTTVNSRLRNITIAQGVNNTTTLKTIIHTSTADTYQTIYKSANSQYITV